MFGGAGGYGRYRQMQQKATSLPEVQVTREEFIKLMVESGKTQKDAELQAIWSEGLGSSMMIGDKMVSIKAT